MGVGGNHRVALMMPKGEAFRTANANICAQIPLCSRHPEMTFALCNEDSYATEMEAIGLGDTGEDVNAAIVSDKSRWFPMEPEDDFVEAFEEFLSKYPAYLKPFVRSGIF